jgi:16S rRNA pseudouridine516 synthase
MGRTRNPHHTSDGGGARAGRARPCRRGYHAPVSRLYELLAWNLACSKGEARRLIEDGEVCTPAGATLTNPRQDIPAADLPLPIIVAGEAELLREHVLVLQHKPVGVVTALRDDRYPTAYGLLEDAPLHPHLRPVGRLDLDTAGLLLWTTDGPLLQRLTHPKRALPRTYHAALARPFRALAPGEQLVLEDGHQPNVTALAVAAPVDLHPALARPADAALYATITITGGAYHEVRRIFAALDSHVLALARVAFGRLALPTDLPAGAFREIEAAAI